MNKDGKLIPTTSYDEIPQLAQYGNIMVTADNLALQRGSGNFNPPPKFEQTVDRGPSFSQALNYYGNYDRNNYYQMDKNYEAREFEKSKRYTY